MKYGWINTNLLDIRKQPKFQSERVNQLLWGDTVEISSSKQGYFKIKKYDGYEGWVDHRMIELIKRKEFYDYRKKVNRVVIKNTAKIYDLTKKVKQFPFRLYYGTKLFVISKDILFSKAKLPNGYVIFVKNTDIDTISKKNEVDTTAFCDEFIEFLGIPYLWGGITTVGFDCSGMIQTVFSRFGIKYPRDTKDQIKIGRKISRDSIKTGDILFFDRHVAVALNRDDYIHCSIGGGGVRTNSFDSSKVNYRFDLDRNYKLGKRLSCFK